MLTASHATSVTRKVEYCQLYLGALEKDDTYLRSSLRFVSKATIMHGVEGLKQEVVGGLSIQEQPPPPSHGSDPLIMSHAHSS